MPKLANVRERRHQPFYDTLVRKSNNTTGTDLTGITMAAGTDLFTATTSSLALSNFGTAGSFPSDQTFVVLAYRVWLYFVGNSVAAIANGRVINGDFLLY